MYCFLVFYVFLKNENYSDKKNKLTNRTYNINKYNLQNLRQIIFYKQ